VLSGVVEARCGGGFVEAGEADPLSPNNPIRPAPGLSTPGLDPAVEAFYRRVAERRGSNDKVRILAA
jgi:hypothetical protein